MNSQVCEVGEYMDERYGQVRRICDIYDFFAPYTNVLTYLLTYYVM